MKKILMLVLSMVLLIGLGTTSLANKNSNIQVTVDGQVHNLEQVNVEINGIKMKSDVPSIKYKSNTIAPLRALSEQLGAKVEWEAKTQTATVKTPTKTIIVPINSSKVTVNGKSEYIENGVQAKLISTKTSKGSSTMIPLRFIAETLGAKVEWSASTNTASVISSSKDSDTSIETNKIVGIEKQLINGKEAIVIKNTYASEIKPFSLNEPDRVVIDFKNTDLNGTSSNLKTDLVKEIRTNQFDEQTSRIVLDISDDYENHKYSTEKRGSDIIVYINARKKDPAVIPPTPPVVVPPVVTPPKPPTSGKKVIVIDAGHGGGAPGASGNGLTEKDLTLNVALRTEKKLKDLGYTVLMTRTTDVNPSFADRYNLSNNNNADAFLSIHFNSFNSKATGIETLYSTHNKDSKSFAQSIQNELIGETKAIDRSLKERNGLAVLRGTKGISALAELGFIDNPNDAKEIRTDSYLEKCAKALANGIHKFFSK